MDRVSLIRDVLLLIVGGIVTFAVTMAVGHLRRQKPHLTWRLLPPVTFAAENVTAFNLVVANEGSGIARDVRVAISGPSGASFASLEVEADEKAMRYEVEPAGHPNEAVVCFPSINSALSCVLTIMAKDLDPDSIRVSVVGADVVGRSIDVLSDYTQTRIRRMTKLFPLLAVAMFIPVLLLLVVSFVTSLASANYLQELEIASLYSELGRHDLAAERYQKMVREWWFPATTRLYYRLAAETAADGDSRGAAYFLAEAVRRSDASFDVIELARVDPRFENLMESPDFKDLERELGVDELTNRAGVGEN